MGLTHTTKKLGSKRSCTTLTFAVGFVFAASCGLTASVSPAFAQIGFRANPAPITAPLRRSLNVLNNQVSRGVSQLNRGVNKSVNQMNRSVNRGINRMNSASYPPRNTVRYPSTTTYQTQRMATTSTIPQNSYTSPQSPQRQTTPQRPQQKFSKDQIKAMQEQQKAIAKSQAALGILPPAVLFQLSENQVGLQNAAQAAALDAEIGEIIEWTYEDGYGSVQALSEDTFGTLRCRDFEQVITLDGVSQSATGSACARGNGQWARAND